MYILKVRSENGYGILRPGLKTGVENGTFWSEIGSGFGEAGGTPPPKILRSMDSASKASNISFEGFYCYKDNLPGNFLCAKSKCPPQRFGV